MLKEIDLTERPVAVVGSKFRRSAWAIRIDAGPESRLRTFERIEPPWCEGRRIRRRPRLCHSVEDPFRSGVCFPPRSGARMPARFDRRAPPSRISARALRARGCVASFSQRAAGPRSLMASGSIALSGPSGGSTMGSSRPIIISTCSSATPPRLATKRRSASTVSFPSPIVAEVATRRTSSGLTPKAWRTRRRSNAISAACAPT